MNKLKKIDIHVHSAALLEQTIRTDGFNAYPTYEELRKIYDELNIEKGALMTLCSPEGVSRIVTSEETWLLAKEHPDTYIWFCNVDPRQGKNDPDGDLVPLLEHYKRLGAKGVGEVTANLYFDDPYMYNLFTACEKCDLPVTIHIGIKNHSYGIVDDYGLPRLEKVLQDFPNLKILGHSQRFWSFISGDITQDNWGGYPKGPVVPGGRVIELLEKYPNLYGDMSAGSGGNAFMRDPEQAYKLLERFQDKLLFGTDIANYARPTNAAFSQFLDEAVETGKISQEVYYKICRGNALKLLGITE